MKLRLLLLIVLTFHSYSTHAASKIISFPNTKMEQDYKWLIRNLRCQKCENQSLADSEAGLASDLRNKVNDLLRQGKSREQIISYLTERFGDRVSYDPAFKASTLLLWTLPFILFGITVYAMNRSIRKNRSTASRQTDSLSEEEQHKLQTLISRTQDTNRE